MSKPSTSNVISWICQVIAAAVLLPASYMKLTGTPRAIHLFSELGMEPTGRIIIGVLEGLATLLLLSGHLAAHGAALAISIMTGAVIAHLTKLGFMIGDDEGLQIIKLLTVLISSSGVAWIRRDRLPLIGFTFQDRHDLE
jgi:uncharacterized membrane protein YphA (DoxX/SURF4 family)